MYKGISNDELLGIMRVNCDFHDAEISKIEYSERDRELEIKLIDLLSFGGKENWYKPSLPSLNLKLGGCYISRKLEPTVFEGYGVDKFEILEGRGFKLQSLMGTLEGTFSSVFIEINVNASRTRPPAN